MKLKLAVWILVPTITLAGAFLLRGCLGGGLVGESYRGAQLLYWQDLAALDYQTGEAPRALRNLEGKTVMIPGFIVPLSDNLMTFDEFLLVPDAMACIHAPPPPPNQMVYVKLKEPISYQMTFDPVWIRGPLQISMTASEYGQVGYSVEVESVERYRPLQ